MLMRSAVLHRMLPLAAVLVALVVAPSGGAASARAAASGDTTVALTSAGDWVTQGKDFFFDPSSASISATLNGPSSLSVSVWQSNYVWFHLSFGAPTGQDLAVGDYVHAARDATAPNEPYIDVGGEGRELEGELGSFRIRRLTTDGDGNLTSLWLTFEVDVGGYLFGEVRYNVPPDGSAVVEPGDLLWPEMEPDEPALIATAFVWNPTSGPVQMGSASISGPSAGDDSILSDTCSGETVAAGGACRIRVRYRPLAVGNSVAALEVPEVGGPTHEVSLDGFVRSTSTEFKLQSDPGDYIGQGENFDFPASNSSFSIQSGSTSDVYVDWAGGGKNGNWTGDFHVPDGQVLTPGTTYTGGLSVSGNSRACNAYSGSFTVTDFTMDAWGQVQSFGIEFTQYCGTVAAGPALHGTLDYRVDDVSVTHAAKRLIVSGQVSSGARGQTVHVELDREVSGHFVRVTRKALSLNGLSIYSIRLARPKSHTCRVIARLPKSGAALPATVSRTFHC